MAGVRDMTALCPELRENARKNETVLLHSLAELSQKAVADRLGVSEATVSRMKSEGQLENMSALLAAMGLKLVPCDAEAFTPEYIAALRTLAQRGI